MSSPILDGISPVITHSRRNKRRDKGNSDFESSGATSVCATPSPTVTATLNGTSSTTAMNKIGNPESTDPSIPVTSSTSTEASALPQVQPSPDHKFGTGHGHPKSGGGNSPGHGHGNSDSHKDKISTDGIIAVVLGILSFVIILCAIFFFLGKRQRARKARELELAREENMKTFTKSNGSDDTRFGGDVNPRNLEEGNRIRSTAQKKDDSFWMRTFWQRPEHEAEAEVRSVASGPVFYAQ